MIWSIYNEKLVRRGEIFVEQYIFGDWSKELSLMNDGKVGKPFDYADTFMALLASIIHQVPILFTIQADRRICQSIIIPYKKEGTRLFNNK
jgi:hypothetical protein